MNTGLSSRIASLIERLSQLAAWIGTSVGLLVFVAWKVPVVAIITAGSDHTGMARSTAIALALIGASILSLDEAHGAWIKRAGAAAALLAIMIGISSLLHLALGWPSYLDENFGALPVAAALRTVRMAPNTAICIILLGLSSLLIDVRIKNRCPTQWCALGAGGISFAASVGYAYNVTALYGVPGYTGMAVHSALVLLILATGLLFARPCVGLMVIFSREGPIGRLVRRLFPAAVAAPVLTGWFRLAAQHAGWYGTEVGTALYATLNVLFLLLFLYLAVASRAVAEEKFRALLESAPDAMVIVDQTGRIVLVNAQTEQIFGYSREQLLGNSLEMLLPEDTRERHTDLRTRYTISPQLRPMGAGLALRGRRNDGTVFPVEVSLAPMRNEDGILISSTIRDITERKQNEDERERLIIDLQSAISQVKVLSGLLPMCAACKKIRDEQNNWIPVESYVRDRSDANFSHGICPDCARKLYPEFVKDGGPKKM